MTKNCFLFDFKGRINYIIQLHKKVQGNNQKFYLEVLCTKDMSNILYDRKTEILVNNINYANIIYARRTEFGESYEIDKLLSILKYNFNIKKDIEYKNNILWKDNNKNLEIKQISKKSIILSKIIKYRSIIPVIQKNNLSIEMNSICIIEYIYFLCLPLILRVMNEKEKPKILIIADDYGILNYYYKSFYGNELDILYFSININKDDKKLFDEKIKVSEDKIIEINSYEKAFKILNNKNNKRLFDIIIIENTFNESKNNTSIPDIKNDFSKFLTDNGIYSINLRSQSLCERERSIEKLKLKFKKVKIIKLRICSDILICLKEDVKIILIDDYYTKYPKIKQLREIYLSQFITDLKNSI